jgi:hypothetical protein
VAHAGECGVTGDPCGGFAGLACQPEHKCRYGEGEFSAPYPDAMGACVVERYCDVPANCEGLIHPAVPGRWACEDNACMWDPAIGEWEAFSEGEFGTPHPYFNNTSVWHRAWLPSGATKMRMVLDGPFRLESGYDFLEVWTWDGYRWNRIRRYTGSTGPAPTDEFAGRYHYLRFVSDSSIIADGFSLHVEFSRL